MNTLLENINAVNDLILEGKALEAFEQYYHEDVVMQENDNPIMVGKEANRKREEDFFNSITEFRGAKVLNVALSQDNTTMVEWHMDYTHKEWGVKNITQVAIQQWENGQIKSEKFYYGS